MDQVHYMLEVSFTFLGDLRKGLKQGGFRDSVRLGEDNVVSVRVETESILKEFLGSGFIIVIYTEQVDHN